MTPATESASVASILAAISLPISAWLLHAPPVLVAGSAVIAVFVVIRHRENIARLRAGTESKVGSKSAAPKS